MYSVGDNDAYQLRDSCKQQIGFRCPGRQGLAACDAIRVLEKANGPLNCNTVAVKIVPMHCTARDAGVKPEILVEAGVGVPAADRIRARGKAGAEAWKEVPAIRLDLWHTHLKRCGRLFPPAGPM